MREGRKEQSTKIDTSADWICLNCNNLNYSFRKVCNRCRSITRQQNHQNYLQMQFLHAYYHPFRQEDTVPVELSPLAVAPLAHQHLHTQEFGVGFIKEPLGTEQQNYTQMKNHDCNQSGFMFLLENAWQGLYTPTEISQFKSCDEAQKTREEEDSYENEDILSNFDLTFI